MFTILGVLSGVINAVGYIPYIRDVIKRKTKPDQASWLIWNVLGAIAFFSQLAQGADNSLWMSGVQMFGIFLIFILALKYGSGGFTKKDIYALVFAAFGLIGWYVTNDPTIALFIAIGINAIGAYLTMIKAYKKPDSETRIAWIFGTVASFLAILSVGSMDIILISYPLYIFISNTAIITAMVLGDKRYARNQQIEVAYEYESNNNEKPMNDKLY
jgi:hypothetical protein